MGIDGYPERLELSADSFEDLSDRGMPRFAGELSADPRVSVDRVKYLKRDGTDRGLWLLFLGHFRQCAGENMPGGSGKQAIPIRDKGASCR